VLTYPHRQELPQVARMRTGEHDPARGWRYLLHYRVGSRTRSLVRWFRSDLEAWQHILRDRGEGAEEDGAVGWDACLEAYRRARTRTEGQVLRVERAVRLLREAHPGSPDSLDPAALGAFLATLGAGPGARVLRHLKAVVRAAMGSGLRLAPAWERLRPAARKTSRRQRATPEQVPALLAALPEDLRLLARWVALTGCRQGAACRILVDDVRDGRVILREKADASPDYQLDEHLGQVVADARAHRKRVGSRSDRLFVDARGRAWEPSRVAQVVKRCWPPGITMHSLRHMWGHGVASLGLGADMVQAALGHRARASSIPYVHTVEDSRARASAQATMRQVVADAVAGRSTPVAQTGRETAPAAPHGTPPHPSEAPQEIACPHCGKSFSVSGLYHNALHGADLHQG